MTTQTTPRPPLWQFLFNFILTLVAFPALMLFLGGNWLWVEGLLFGLWMSAMILGSLVYLYIKDPALLAERSKRPGSDNQKSWDKYVLSSVYLIAIVWLVMLPLDAERFHWSPTFPLWLKVIGGLMLLPALYFIQRATMDNTYLSAMVRIQGDRKHHVVTTGSYGIVRHPLYLGCILMMFGSPLLVGSVIGLLISLVGFIILIYRINGEEHMLATELEGYEEYKQKVRYRLIPFVW